MRYPMLVSVILVLALCAGRAAGAADERVRCWPMSSSRRRKQWVWNFGGAVLSIDLENPSLQRLEAELLVPVPGRTRDLLTSRLQIFSKGINWCCWGSTSTTSRCT